MYEPKPPSQQRNYIKIKSERNLHKHILLHLSLSKDLGQNPGPSEINGKTLIAVKKGQDFIPSL